MFQSPWIRFARKTLGSSDNAVSLAVSIPVDNKVRAGSMEQFHLGRYLFQSPWIRFALA